ncbi:hypothetical protein DFJ74DRAFT_691328 [Hyaloraphidium curvatum]|nr:hypothetical protein DFJ74DRAFT_691328 [Hyaloraphidium curvatum]
MSRPPSAAGLRHGLPRVEQLPAAVAPVRRVAVARRLPQPVVQAAALEVGRALRRRGREALAAVLGRPDAVPRVGGHAADLAVLRPLDRHPAVRARGVLQAHERGAAVGRAVGGGGAGGVRGRVDGQVRVADGLRGAVGVGCRREDGARRDLEDGVGRAAVLDAALVVAEEAAARKVDLGQVAHGGRQRGGIEGGAAVGAGDAVGPVAAERARGRAAVVALVHEVDLVEPRPPVVAGHLVALLGDGGDVPADGVLDALAAQVARARLGGRGGLIGAEDVEGGLAPAADGLERLGRAVEHLGRRHGQRLGHGAGGVGVPRAGAVGAGAAEGVEDERAGEVGSVGARVQADPRVGLRGARLDGRGRVGGGVARRQGRHRGGRGAGQRKGDRGKGCKRLHRGVVWGREVGALKSEPVGSIGRVLRCPKEGTGAPAI